MYRLLLIGSVFLWLGAMTALFVRDVWPAWTAQDAPPITKELLNQIDHRQEQYGIFDQDGARMGTAWTNILTAGGNTTIYGTAALSVSAILPMPELRIETVTEFADDGALDSFNLDVFGVPMTTIKVRGERRGVYFPCELQVGPLHRQANLELSASRMIGDALRPFSFLPTLKVGQSWRMQVLDPMSAVMTRQTQFTSVIATVTGEETVQHAGRSIVCKVVETSPHHVKAWVAPEGRVVIQEAQLPAMGKYRIRQEPFDENARTQARERIRARGPLREPD